MNLMQLPPAVLTKGSWEKIQKMLSFYAVCFLCNQCFSFLIQNCQCLFCKGSMSPNFNFWLEKRIWQPKQCRFFSPEDNFLRLMQLMFFQGFVGFFFWFHQQTEKPIYCLHSFGFMFTCHPWNMVVSSVYIDTVLKIQQCKNINWLQFVWPHSFQIKLAFLHVCNWG